MQAADVRDTFQPEDYLQRFGDFSESLPELRGLKTGIEGLDELFFVVKEGKKVPLGGLPQGAVVNLTGVPDSGKSLMAEQLAVTQAGEGRKVLFVTVESPAAFLGRSLKERAAALQIAEEKLEKNLFVVDAASHAVLRQSLNSLLSTIAYAIKKEGITLTIIDSVTGLYEEREMLARGVVRRLFQFMKKFNQTALFVSQKRSSHEELSAEAAGGFAVAHIVDCTMVVSKYLITRRYEEEMFGRPLGELVRLFRIDGCRLCGHDTATRFLEITEEGLVKIGEKIGKGR